MELPASVINTITLDGDGKRRTIEDSDGLRKLIWDAENILAETDSGGTTQAAYTLAPQAYGSLISQRRSGATSFHHFDALGSTNKLTDAAEATEVEYLYKAFGEQSILSGSSENPFTWVGQLGYYRQPDPSDYWVRARIMNPRAGRWLSREPYMMQSKSYQYVNNRPFVLTDANGLDPYTKATGHPALVNPDYHPAAALGHFRQVVIHLQKIQPGASANKIRDAINHAQKHLWLGEREILFWVEHKCKDCSKKAKRLWEEVEEELRKAREETERILESAGLPYWAVLLILIILWIIIFLLTKIPCPA